MTVLTYWLFGKNIYRRDSNSLEFDFQELLNLEVNIFENHLMFLRIHDQGLSSGGLHLEHQRNWR